MAYATKSAGYARNAGKRWRGEDVKLLKALASTTYSYQNGKRLPQLYKQWKPKIQKLSFAGKWIRRIFRV